MTLTRLVTLTASLTLVGGVAFAKPTFNPKIPNGSKWSCTTCHTKTSSPAAWNSFGLDVKANMNGTLPDWAAVCDMDSDGDGWTNGEELLDPDCSWSVGDPNPGDSADVTKPGDENDHPPEPEPEPEPDVIAEDDVVETPDVAAGPEEDVVETPDVAAGPEEDVVEVPDGAIEPAEEDVVIVQDSGAPEPGPEDAGEVSDGSDAEATPIPEPDIIDLPPTPDTGVGTDSEDWHSQPECFEDSDCPSGSSCDDYVCVSQDGWTAPEPGGSDAEEPGPGGEDDAEDDGAPQEDATAGADAEEPSAGGGGGGGGCQSGESPASRHLSVLALLGMVALVRRRWSLET